MKTTSLDILEKAQLPPAQARAIMQVMDAEFAPETLATKEDLRGMKDDLREELRMTIDIRISAVETKLAEMKAELMRWMLVFWVGQMAATVAIVKFLK